MHDPGGLGCEACPERSEGAARDGVGEVSVEGGGGGAVEADGGNSVSQRVDCHRPYGLFRAAV